MGNFGLVQKRRKDGGKNYSIAKYNGSKNYSIAKNRDTDNDLVTIYGHVPLHYAVSMRDRNAVTYLMSNGAAFINTKDFFGRTALHYAVGERWLFLPRPDVEPSRDIEIVEMLLSNQDIDLNPKDNAGETPLMWAVKIGNFEVVRALLNNCANPNIPNNENRTPLHEALLAQYPDWDNMVLSLLASGAGIYCADNLRQTPIDILVRKVCDYQILSFAKVCVFIIAFRYLIRKSLESTLERIPALSEYFKICSEEVSRMRRHVIYEKITVHDFVADCFQCRGRDVIEEIYKPVVDILLSKSYFSYFNPIFYRMSKKNLKRVLRTAGGSQAVHLLPRKATHWDILKTIGRFYRENA